MTRQEVINILEKQGYKSYPVPRHYDQYSIKWAGSKRLPEGSPECDSNEKKISWHINIYDWAIPNDQYNREFKSIEIEIVAEKHGQWFKLSCYGIRWEDLEKQLPVAEKSLLNSWVACARS